MGEEAITPGRRLVYPWLSTLLLSVLLAVGCHKTPAPQPGDEALAPLEDFLDCWTRGASSDQFAAANPQIHVADPDWKAGSRLRSFLSIEARPGQESGHYQCRVSLSLQDGKGRPMERTVLYDVHLGEATTIKRLER